LKEIIIYVGAFLIALLLLWLAWKRPNRGRLFLRLLASIGAVLSLVFLALPPHRTVSVTPTEAILLTSGYHPDTLQQIQKQLRVQAKIFSYGNTATDYQIINSISEIKQGYPQVKRLHVLGNGLDEVDLKELDSLNLVPHLNALPTGIIGLDWPKHLTKGEKLTVTGRYHQKTNNPTWLYLTFAGKTQDSVQIKNTGINRFSLTYLPKQAGNYVYGLYAKAGNQRALAGEIPLQVKPKTKLRILLLPATPSFEVKFLKNYLAAEQHGVAVRIPVSKDIYQTEWLNLPQATLKQINARLLQQFDLLITDTRTIQELGAVERQALTQSVQNSGLGLIVIPEDLPLTSSPALLKSFQFMRSPLTQPELNATPVSWSNSANNIKTTSLPYTIKQTPDLKKLAWNKTGSTLVATKRNNWGKITLSLLPQTYTWPLAGNKSAYAEFWSLLLSQTSKPQLTDHTWHVEAAPLPLVNQPLTFYLADYTQTSDNSFPQGIVQEVNQKPDTVYLAQKVLLPHRFTGLYWPRNHGWLQVKKPASTTQLFYVHADSSFVAWRQATRLNSTRNFIQTAAKNTVTSSVITKKQPWPVIYFFLSFLLCAGFLWLEEKW